MCERAWFCVLRTVRTVVASLDTIATLKTTLELCMLKENCLPVSDILAYSFSLVCLLNHIVLGLYIT